MLININKSFIKNLESTEMSIAIKISQNNCIAAKPFWGLDIESVSGIKPENLDSSMKSSTECNKMQKNLNQISSTGSQLNKKNQRMVNKSDGAPIRPSSHRSVSNRKLKPKSVKLSNQLIGLKPTPTKWRGLRWLIWKRRIHWQRLRC